MKLTSNIVRPIHLFATVTTLVACAQTTRAEAPHHGISAGSLNVVQNDTNNTASSVTVTLFNTVNDFRVRTGSNRADYNVQMGSVSTDDVIGGVLISSISQNGRDNLETAFPGTNFLVPAIDVSGTSPNRSYLIPVFGLGNGASREYNINVAGAWFPYTNWIGAHVQIASGANGSYSTGVTNDLIVGTTGLAFGQNFTGIAAGKGILSLTNFGIDSRTNGVLLVVGGKNEGNYALSQVNSDGTWTVYVKDKDSDGSTYEEDPFAFVFIPKTNTAVISGRFLGSGAIDMFSGNSPQFTVSSNGVGVYELKMNGRSPTNGVLIISAEGGQTINQDNIVSYNINTAGDGWIIQSRDLPNATLESPGPTEPVVSFVYIPVATPGITADPSVNLVTSESGGSTNFNVTLDTMPAADVTVTVSSSNPSEGTASPPSLTFNSGNWNVPQQVTVTGQDDAIVDGAVAYNIVLTPSSTDPVYNALAPTNVPVVNTDNESGITVTPASGLITTEAGGQATFTVRLNTQPAADVTIGLSSSATNEGTVSPPSLTFNSSDWDQEKTVTVTGVNDFIDDGDVAYTIITAPAVSSDGSYSGFNAPDVTVTNIDDDTVGIIVTPTSGLTVTESGTTTNYSIVLLSQPTANVVVTVTCSDTTEASVSPGTVTFTPADWNTPKTVTITGANDSIQDGSISYTITNVFSSTDPKYAAFTPVVVSAITLDNEAAITVSAGETFYGIGMPAVGVDGRVSIFDPYSPNYNGGTLSLTLTANGISDDRLEIRNTGTDAGQIGVSGSTASYGGVPIATFSGGTGTSPLNVSFNSAATPSAAEALLRSVTFRTLNSASVQPSRTVSIAFTDGDGGVSTTVSKTVRVGLLRQSWFQEGVDGGYGMYTGGLDIQLHQPSPDTAFPIGNNPTTGLWVNWPDTNAANASQALLRFENIFGTNSAQVPTNAVIVGAELMLHINDAGDGSPLYRMLVPWDANTSTWNSMVNGLQPDDNEARSVADSQINLEDGSGSTGTGSITVSVTPDVVAWASGQTNYGWAMPGWQDRRDGTGFSPCEATNVSDRPRLRVLWLPAGTPGVAFRQGVNGYASEFDTAIRLNTPDGNFGTNDFLYCDAIVTGSTNNPQQILLRFDNIIGSGAGQVPPNAKIHAAIIDLASIGNLAQGDGGQFYALLQPWQDTTATWNTWVGGITPDGIEAALTPTAVAGNSSGTPQVQGGYNFFEVTSDVAAWASGTRTNYGWAILPWPSGGDGWGIGMAESAVTNSRPQLRVYYTAASDIVIRGLVRTQTTVTIQFAGIAGTTYSVQRSSEAAGPYVTLGSAPAAQDGTAGFTDNSPLPTRAFYRISYP